jgi:glycosyltransferase involved in cell wall biosynthesis
MRVLQVNLDAPLPTELGVGSGTALFVHGTCFDAERAIRRLAFVVGGDEQPVASYGMPRLDCFRALHPRLDPFATDGVQTDAEAPEDPRLHSYRSGFWGLARIGPSPPGSSLHLALRATFEGGATDTAELGRIRVAVPPDPLAPAFPGPPGEPRVAICMATHEPPVELLRRQLDSIRAQTHANWVCVISDDCSQPDRFDAICELVRDDPRFAISRSTRRLGFYANFERTLALAPHECDYLALADQDDVWDPDKLAVVLEAMGNAQPMGIAQLAYSDARIIGRDGEVIADSYWHRRRNNHSDLTSLLVANSVTGAASLFRRRLLDYALPFPPGQFAHYHDHWLALVALVTGGIEYVDRPLYDYVQHGHAALGHEAANRVTSIRARLARLREDPRERVRLSSARYFRDVMRLQALAAVLELRCGRHMEDAQRRALERFLALERSWPALAWFGWRAGRELSRSRPETLGAEWVLLQALMWRRIVPATARERPQPGLRLDAVPPPDLAPRTASQPPRVRAVREVAEKITPLELAVSDEAPQRLNVLIPTIDLEHLFGGYIAKLNLAQRLAERGTRVRLVTVDPVPPLPHDWRRRIESYSGLAGLFDRVELGFGRGAGPVEVSRDDRFVASTWWTAHIAQAAVTQLGASGFVYLVQEYEPFTFPMSSYAALAQQSYGFEHFALFSSELLRGYFRAHGLGVYAAGIEAGDGASAAFQNAITAIDPPDAASLSARRPHRLLFHARPEPHAARNLFELGILALQQAASDGEFRGWELRGIGSLGRAQRIQLEHGSGLELLPRRPQADYARTLAEHDVGLALMYTPHPSLVPIEMAAAGMLTVTNTFENKTAEELRAISTNLIAGEPTIDGIAGALRDAAAGVGNIRRRIEGSAVNWSRDWRNAFDDQLLARVQASSSR